MLGPTIEELAGELQGKVVFGKLNTDLNRKLPRQYGIMSIPTILFYKEGEVVGKTVGALPKEYILEAIEQAFGELN
jgi:thioredoxin 1